MRSLAALLCLLVFPLLLRAEEDERDWREQPFLGLSVRDTDRGLVVGWVSPGPLGGRGFESASGIQRGDNVVSVDGRAVDAAGFKAAREGEASPATRSTRRIDARREARADAAIPQGGAGGEERYARGDARRPERLGRYRRPRAGGRVIPEPAEGAFESLVLEAAAEAGARAGREGVGGGLDALLPYLARIQEDALDPGSLPAVVNAFRRPLSVDAVEEKIARAMKAAAAGDPSSSRGARAAGAGSGEPGRPDPGGDGARAGRPGRRGRSARCSGSRDSTSRRRSTRGRGARRRSGSSGRCGPRSSSTTITRRSTSGPSTWTSGHGRRTCSGSRSSCCATRRVRWEAQAASHAADAPRDDVPEAVRAFVEGDVLWHGRDALGRLTVVGGAGPNRYAMRGIAAVYDVGGNDRYDYAASPTPDTAPIALRLVVDLAGDDVHESTADFEGPATGVFGLSLLDDRAGDDVYRSRRSFSIGAGLVGLGVLLDHAGDDVYENLGEDSGWAIGVGFWGAGLMIDRAGADVYHGEKHVQGVGGPRGLGAIVDAQGRDLYRANGPSFASAYDTPAVYLGMSQGFGIGVRGYAAGGVGALYDLAGHDRYEAGEFSQAGGYYFGLGILHDVAGDDLYHGNRYGQAFAAHQAVGVLVDDAGDDTYWSMTAASQAGTWDQSIGLLLDKAGNDAYRCDGLGQGGASMQAIALLIDLGGNDRYTGHGRLRPGAGRRQRLSLRRRPGLLLQRPLRPRRGARHVLRARPDERRPAADRRLERGEARRLLALRRVRGSLSKTPCYAAGTPGCAGERGIRLARVTIPGAAVGHGLCPASPTIREVRHATRPRPRLPAPARRADRLRRTATGRGDAGRIPARSRGAARRRARAPGRAAPPRRRRDGGGRPALRHLRRLKPPRRGAPGG